MVSEISTLKLVELQNFRKKLKCVKLGPKTPDISAFGPEFSSTIVIFEISTLKFVYLQNFVKNQKCLSSGPKMPCLGPFKLEWKGLKCVKEGINIAKI